MSIIHLDCYILQKIIYFLSQSDLFSLCQTCTTFRNLKDNIYTIRGCLDCVNKFNGQYKNLTEVQIFNDDCRDNDDLLLSDTVERIFIEDETSIQIAMPTPKSLKIFHAGGVFISTPVGGPNLEEFIQGANCATPDTYEFDDTSKLRILDSDKYEGDTLPIDHIQNSPIEYLATNTASDDKLKNLTSLRYLNLHADIFTGDCFRSLTKLEFLSFSFGFECDHIDMFNFQNLKYLINLEALNLCIEHVHLDDLKYINYTIKHLRIGFFTQICTQELVELVLGHFSNLQSFTALFSIKDLDCDEEIKITDHVLEEIQKIKPNITHSRGIISSISDNFVSKPNNESFSVCKCAD